MNVSYTHLDVYKRQGPNVNPLASRDAKIMPLAMSNARASEAPSQGGDGDFVYAFNNFQYVDTYNLSLIHI